MISPRVARSIKQAAEPEPVKKTVERKQVKPEPRPTLPKPPVDHAPQHDGS